MAEFSKKSLTKLETCHPDLQILANEAIKHMDFSIVWGYRNKEQQDKCFQNGTGVAWPTSKHNHMAKRMVDSQLVMMPESLAIDVAPVPLDWKDIERFCILIGVFKTCASIMNIPIRFGRDIRKGDYGHVELDM